MRLRLRLSCRAHAVIKIRAGSADGPLLGSTEVTATAEPLGAFQSVEVDFVPGSEWLDRDRGLDLVVCVCGDAADGELLWLDRFWVTAAAAAAAASLAPAARIDRWAYSADRFPSVWFGANETGCGLVRPGGRIAWPLCVSTHG